MTILIVDDHALIREALRGVLAELSDEPVVEAVNARAALESVDSDPEIRLAVVDLHLPDRDGFDVLKSLRAMHPTVAVVVLSAASDKGTVRRALDAGALGFIPKSSTREVMVGALRLVFAGGVYIPPEVLGADVATATRRSPADVGLTDRQTEVLRLMMEGKSNKLICRALALAEPTVKTHVSAVLRALNAANRTEAVLAAASLDWEDRSGS
jgi:DNA-binding NarL/FixJ family response regulator